MMYPYMTLSDGTEIVHSHLITEKNPPEIEVNFECPVDGGFKSARCVLPSYTWINNEGYSKEEIDFFTNFLEHNAHLLYKYAANGGIQIA